jgi:tyrosinase
MTVNISPVAPTLASASVYSNGFLTYLPRCLKRDVNPWVSSNWTRDIDSYTLINDHTNITSFQNYMQGNGFLNGFYGVHAGGHYTIGGDPGGDFFVSPGDPVFFLHHAQIDRTWWIWQNQDLASRQNAIGGTITLFDSPPSRDGVLTDWLDMTVVGQSNMIQNVMNTQGGPLCYIYV